jgi:hypothetical protein
LRVRARNIICVRAGPNRHGDPTMRMFVAVSSTALALAAQALVMGVFITL